jgi:hypothetical protein
MMNSTTTNRLRRPLLFFSVLIICTTWMVTAISSAQKVDKSIPKQQRTLALAEDEVKQLILLMDTNKNGKISRQEFLSFMEAEFDRLDKDKSGELDPKELSESQVRAARPAVGK